MLSVKEITRFGRQLASPDYSWECLALTFDRRKEVVPEIREWC
jgi:hypothetical protein